MKIKKYRNSTRLVHLHQKQVMFFSGIFKVPILHRENSRLPK